MGVSEDTDAREGFYSGTITFGANQVQGQIDESNIKEYKIFITDWMGIPIGASVATVAKTSTLKTCCDQGLYSAALAGVPLPADGRYVTVHPVDTNDFVMPLGHGAAIHDFIRTTTQTTTTRTTTLTATSVTITTVETTTTAEEVNAAYRLQHLFSASFAIVVLLPFAV